MSLNRFAKRRDATEAPIVRDLRRCGFRVRQQDFPDLVVQRPSDRKNFLVELDGITKHRKRSVKQLEFIAEWGIPIFKTFDEVLEYVSG